MRSSRRFSTVSRNEADPTQSLQLAKQRFCGVSNVNKHAKRKAQKANVQMRIRAGISIRDEFLISMQQQVSMGALWPQS